MCLAIPSLIIEKNGSEAKVDIGGITRTISLWLTPEAKQGDYVLVHAGYAINLINRDEALETLDILRTIAIENEQE